MALRNTQKVIMFVVLLVQTPACTSFLEASTSSMEADACGSLRNNC